MQINSIRSFRGRNIYSHKPLIKVILDIGDLYDTPTKDIPNFNKRILEMFPGLKKHYCSMGFEGGFKKRLEEGTYIGHVIEHIILEMQTMLGYDVSYGKTRVISEPSLYYIVYEYKNEKCAIECGKAAVEAAVCIIEGRDFDIEKLMDNLKSIAMNSDLGPTTKAIYDKACERGIPVMRLGNDSILQLGYGKYSRLLEASLTDKPSCICVDIAGNKQLTKEILRDNGIPTPQGEVAYTLESAVKAARDIGYPVVIKPYNGNQGRGVTLNITDENLVEAAYNEALKHSNAVIIEKYIRGRDYRVLVVGNHVAAVAERRPPSVEGDGIHSIKELVEIENLSHLRGEDHEKPLTRIKIDEVANQVLKAMGYEENYIPEKDERVLLRNNGNISTGGTARDCTSEIHPINSSIAVKAAKAIGLDIAGIDITTEDISVPITEETGAVIEVNAAPGIRMHLYPSEGEKVDVAKDIIDMMFPPDKLSSIPLISVTGTNGKTTTTRLIAHTLSLTGKKVGMTTTSGVYVGGECILKGDNTGPVSARMVLSDKEVEAAVLETARGGIVKKGLGYDLADVGIVLNVSDDHLGLDGLNTLEDIAFTKSLIIEAIKPEGYSVLNADDEMVQYLIKRAAGNVILFSKSSSNPLVNSHIANGGTAVYVDENVIHICSDNKTTPIIDINEIPITFFGAVECNIENSLAAAAALYAINVPAPILREGFGTFMPDINSNPGRFNLFDMGNFKVMLDYSHNGAGYREVSKFISSLEAKRLVGVIGMPGDRQEKSMREVGKICAGVFSKIYVKEDMDLRGKKKGEVAQILMESILSTGFKKENVEIINSELKALETAMLDAQPGDFIVMFYEEFEPAVNKVMSFKEELHKNEVSENILLEANETVELQ